MTKKTASFEKVSLFDSETYKKYLSAMVGDRDQKNGIRSSIAKALNCQPTYISQVFYGSAHLSLEQAYLLSDFLGHTKEEKQYFLLLIQRDRAGTQKLERFFNEELQQIIKKRKLLSERLDSQSITSASSQSIYYSSWQYAAVHMALTVPELQTPRALEQHLSISPARITSILEFLCATGLAVKKGSKYTSGDVHIHLHQNSPNIIKHHGHWRQQAIESLERTTSEDVHYSAVVTLSAEDAIKIRNKIMKLIEESIAMIRPSPAEELYCFSLDFFNLKRN